MTLAFWSHGCWCRLFVGPSGISCPVAIGAPGSYALQIAEDGIVWCCVLPKKFVQRSLWRYAVFFSRIRSPTAPTFDRFPGAKFQFPHFATDDRGAYVFLFSWLMWIIYIGCVFHICVKERQEYHCYFVCKCVYSISWTSADCYKWLLVKSIVTVTVKDLQALAVPARQIEVLAIWNAWNAQPVFNQRWFYRT